MTKGGSILKTEGIDVAMARMTIGIREMVDELDRIGEDFAYMWGAVVLDHKSAYRAALELRVTRLPWWRRAEWFVWIWLMDRAGYHWECGPLPGGAVYFSPSRRNALCPTRSSRSTSTAKP